MIELTQMWGVFALLAILSCLFVVMPFLRKEKVVSVDHDANAQRIEIYHQRLDELKGELENQRIGQNDFEESVIELKRRLLNELSPEQTLDTRGNNLVLGATGIAFTLVVSSVFYYFTGSHQQIANWQKAVEKLPEYGERAVLQTGEPLSANELQAFALGLRTKLANSGDDAVAWMLLGRVAMSLNDYEMAMQAFDKALIMQPDNHNVLVNYSQALLIEGSEPSINRAARMLSRVLRAEPQNIDAISLLALIAYEREDWLEAKSAFEVLLSTVQPNDPRYAMIKQRIGEIAEKLGEPEPVDSGAGPQLSVQVRIDDKLLGQLPDNATLFVFAKAANGPRMPLAVQKLTVFNLPLVVTLNDSMAMLPDLKLSNFNEVVITARISVDDSVMTQAGELEGTSDVVTINKDTRQQVNVIISRVITSTGS
ncbi:c-type cytochrome biogenesis protein CcmI [Pseudoalteromonas luteoviolacea]|uniref:c-type cytochrome biogenesis protein CcmI n=1 Tax=Pseudoalteromonas luteoviolacea TaxID=43657 RepID=UPI001B39E93A|nr:c-type cytochrome biogenesis protein CcmI [Pseudoalteromonas luteoviolacea]MBQ4879995.1 c-type cytochrome biogenesis protein CcmI [Pseudoalteromonas luteoviolacea]MBQ4909012.1 c-type cytochrome biogenesis protein CcmI [Pseudoalteromonas luteoviolacea]